MIIDSDLLFLEKDFNKNELDSCINKSFYKKCEEKYQKEKTTNFIEKE